MSILITVGILITKLNVEYFHLILTDGYQDGHSLNSSRSFYD